MTLSASSLFRSKQQFGRLRKHFGLGRVARAVVSRSFHQNVVGSFATAPFSKGVLSTKCKYKSSLADDCIFSAKLPPQSTGRCLAGRRARGSGRSKSFRIPKDRPQEVALQKQAAPTLPSFELYPPPPHARSHLPRTALQSFTAANCSSSHVVAM